MASAPASTPIGDGLRPKLADPNEQRPLGGYAALTSTFFAALAIAVAAARASGRRPPERIGAGDLVMMGVATHKLARLISKDRVTAFLRAPFASHQDDAGHGEVEEQPQGSGLRLAVGELLVCPYCLGQWISAGFAAGYVLAPRPTRLIAASYTAETIADFLQLLYKAAEDRA